LKGKVGLEWVLIALVALAYLGNFFAPWGFKSPLLATAGGGPTAVQQGQLACPSGLTTLTAYSAVRSALSGSLNYTGSPVAYTLSDGSTVVATDTSNGGSSLSYKSTAIPCTPETYGSGIVLYALSNSTLNGAKSELLTYGGATSVQKELVSSYIAPLTFVIRDAALANLSNPSTGSTTSVTETNAVAMGAGSARTGYIDVWEATAASQYGSDDGGILWAIDTVNSTAFSDNAISLQSASPGFDLTPVSCSAYKAGSFDSANRCYKSRAIKVTDATLRIAFTIVADNGIDPTTTNPVIYVEDINYALDTNSKVILDTMKSDGTQIGAAQNKITFSIS